MKIGEILLKNKAIHKDGPAKGLEQQKSTGHKLGHSLIELREITEEQCIQALKEQGKTVVDLNKEKISNGILSILPNDFCKKNLCLPLRLENDILTVVLPDPENRSLIEDIKFLSGKTVVALMGLETQIEKRISRNTQSAGTNQTETVSPVLGEAPKLLDKLLNDSLLMKASDLHLEAEKNGWQVRQRIDGVLHPGLSIANVKLQEIISAVKVRCGLDITEKRLPQDGSFTTHIGSYEIDIRVSVIPGRWGESAVLRFLRKDQAGMSIETLGLLPEQVKTLKEAISLSHGIILSTGPTGAGKSTTLYSLLRLVDRTSRKVLTVEDPIEYELDNVQQVEVNPEIGLTFARVLRHFLRHDPDIIMIGEIRDAETAEIAVRAAMTGHLVLSTLHTNDAISTINRLRDLGIPDHLLFDTLRLVMAQRLVRKWDKADNRFQGRTAVFETLPIDETTRNILLTDDVQTAKNKLIKNGFIPMKDVAQEKVKNGITTNEEITRILGKE